MSSERGSPGEARSDDDSPPAYPRILPPLSPPARACPQCGEAMAAGSVRGGRRAPRWADFGAARGPRQLIGEAIGRGGFRNELPAHRCERCRLIVANY